MNFYQCIRCRYHEENFYNLNLCSECKQRKEPHNLKFCGDCSINHQKCAFCWDEMQPGNIYIEVHNSKQNRELLSASNLFT